MPYQRSYVMLGDEHKKGVERVWKTEYDTQFSYSSLSPAALPQQVSETRMWRS